jgi:hypothetical protein
MPDLLASDGVDADRGLLASAGRAVLWGPPFRASPDRYTA